MVLNLKVIIDVYFLSLRKVNKYAKSVGHVYRRVLAESPMQLSEV